MDIIAYHDLSLYFQMRIPDCIHTRICHCVFRTHRNLYPFESKDVILNWCNFCQNIWWMLSFQRVRFLHQKGIIHLYFDVYLVWVFVLDFDEDTLCSEEERTRIQTNVIRVMSVSTYMLFFSWEMKTVIILLWLCMFNTFSWIKMVVFLFKSYWNICMYVPEG